MTAPRSILICVALTSLFLGTSILRLVVFPSPIDLAKAVATDSESVNADLNGDGVVDVVDLFIVANAFSSALGDDNWNQMADLNNDYVINIIDLYTVAKEFGNGLQDPMLGLWDMGLWDWAGIPKEVEWVFTHRAEYTPSESGANLILNWYTLRKSQPANYFYEEWDLKNVEKAFKELNVSKYWGLIFISEETYRNHVAFYDDVNITWFNEHLCGYDIYQHENSSATKDEWKDEMFLRMIRGFYSYFHQKGVRVGITCKDGAANYHIYHYGEPAANFIKDNYDFIVLYAYTFDLEDFLSRTGPFFDTVNEHFQRLKKFWIITRTFSGTSENWEPEAMALEMKNCFDANIIVTSYVATNSLMLGRLTLKNT